MTAVGPDIAALDRMPAHEETAAIKKRLEEQRAEMEERRAEPQIAPDDPRRKEEYTFNFEWKNRWGKVYRGRFKNRILTIADQSLIGAMQSEFALGKPYNSLDPLTQEINLIVAWIGVSLENVGDSEWAKDWRKLNDIQLIQALYKEVMAHEATFHGLQQDQEGSEENDQ